MKSLTLSKSAMFLTAGFLLLPEAGLAQKTKTETLTDTSYKNNPARTDTYSIIQVQPNTGTSQTSGTVTVVSTSTNTETNTGTNTLIPVKVSTETNTGTGTQPAKDSGSLSQVGGVSKDGTGKSIKKPEASVRYNIVIPSDGGKPKVEIIKVDAPLSCEDATLKEIFRILHSDQQNVFSRMVELTVMRLSKKALEEGNATLEGYTQSKIEDLEKQVNNIKGSKELQEQVQAVYEAYGKKGDLQAIEKDLDKGIRAGKKACYWTMNNQLTNERVSSYVLAMSISDPNAGVSEADVATIWALEKIRTLWMGGAVSGLLDVNYRVARYLGVVRNGVTESEASLDAKIKAEEKSITDLIQQAYSKVKEKFYSCIDQANPNCAQCAIDQKAKFETDQLGLAKIQQKLASEVLRDESKKIRLSIKGKIGTVPFDFAQTLPKGTVEPAPERLREFDACGKRKRSKKLNRTPNQVQE